MEIKKTCYEHISGSDSLVLSCMRIEPVDKDKVIGVVQLVHGMCEYKERYEDFMNYLAGYGYICVIHDHRGHGKSVKDPSDLGFMYEGGYKALIEDVHEVLVETKVYVAQILPDKKLPVTMLGHSMGSMIVRCFIREYDDEIDKLVVVGCPSKLKGMKAGLKFLELSAKKKGEHSRFKLADDLVMNNTYEKRFKSERIKHAWVNSDRAMVVKYNADPLCNYTFTLNGYVNLVKLSMLTYKDGGYAMKSPNLPIKFFSGLDDPCAISKQDIYKAMMLLKKQGYVNVRGKLYPHMRHEILNEPKHMKVYEDILKFIENGDNV